MTAFLSLDKVTKRFKNDLVFEDVCLTAEPGQIVGLVGHNGCGKTVLFKCIVGLQKIQSGQIQIANQVIGRDVEIAQNVGILLEKPGFIPYLSGQANLEQLAAIRRTIDRAQVEAVLQSVGLYQALHKKVSTYSLGMRQRLGIAQAIMEAPDLVILDEPFNGLDKEGLQQIYQVVEDLAARGITILMASHYQADIQRLCQKVYQFENHHLYQQS